MPYAENTSVSPEKSRAEIETTLRRYGAAAFSYGYEAEGAAMVLFRAHERVVKFTINLPPRADFVHDARGRRRTEIQVTAAVEQAERQRWRALALVVKAKLEAVETGITTFEEEFLAHVVLPNGTTVGEFMGPQLQETYATGAMPDVLPAPTRRQLTEAT